MVVNAILPIAYVVVVYYTMRFRYRLVQGLHAPNFGDNVVGAISLSPCYRESCFRDKAIRYQGCRGSIKAVLRSHLDIGRIDPPSLPIP